ncbi:MAG TPA: DUF3450 domain-containing protein [Candidatus Binatia bacterium]|jgi:hypothetical protein
MPNEWFKYAAILAMMFALAPWARAEERGNKTASPAASGSPAAAAAPPAANAATDAPATPAATAAPAAPAGVPLEKLDRVTSEQAASDKDAVASQKRIDSLDDDTQKLLGEYRKAVADTESHEAYASQLQTQIRSQQQELADIDRQLGEIETTSRSIVPLEQKMLDTLKEFVRLDLPFLGDERNARIATLEEMMGRADVSISEKYRRIVEAYQVEMDYGRTIESYEGRLAGEGADRTARFLRIGRLTLMYQTLDANETGYWDATRGKWIVDNDYAYAFKQGVAVAQKLSAPEMLLAPIPAPVEAKS